MNTAEETQRVRIWITEINASIACMKIDWEEEEVVIVTNKQL